jgi:hypothetical protein
MARYIPVHATGFEVDGLRQVVSTSILPAPMPTKVYVQTLGCPKNLVDSEIMLGLAARDGAEIVLDPESADVYVVNTCGRSFRPRCRRSTRSWAPATSTGCPTCSAVRRRPTASDTAARRISCRRRSCRDFAPAPSFRPT